MLNKIFKIANLLDSKGFFKQADSLDDFGIHILTRLAFKMNDGSKEKRDLGNLDSWQDKIEQNIREKIVMDMISGQRKVDPDRFADIFMSKPPVDLSGEGEELSREEERELQNKIREIIQEVVSEQVPDDKSFEKSEVEAITSPEEPPAQKEEVRNVEVSPSSTGKKTKKEKVVPPELIEDVPQKSKKRNEEKKRTSVLAPIIKFFSETEKILTSLFGKTNDDVSELSYRNRLSESFNTIRKNVDVLQGNFLRLNIEKDQLGFDPEEIADLLQEIILSGKDLDVNDNVKIRDFVDAIISAESGISEVIKAKSKYSISITDVMSKIEDAIKAINNSNKPSSKKQEKQNPPRNKGSSPVTPASVESKKEVVEVDAKPEPTASTPKSTPISKEERANQLLNQAVNNFKITYMSGGSINSTLSQNIKDYVMGNSDIKNSTIEVQKLLNLARKSKNSEQVDRGLFYNRILGIAKKLKDGIAERQEGGIGSRAVYFDALEQLDEIMSTFINKAKDALSAKKELDVNKLISVLDGFFNITIESKLPQ